jgi:dephospho-CoA kinase
MRTIVVTGGVAMGKSTVCRLLQEGFSGKWGFFDADRCVHELLTDPGILAKVRLSFGDQVIAPGGHLERSRLRELVFDSADRRAELESILHPEVRRKFQDEHARAREENYSFLADIPLFFESDFPYPADTVLVVASSPGIQESRLLSRSGLKLTDAKKIIHAQMPIDQKIARADAVIFNDGSHACLERQTGYFLQWLTKKTQ